MPSTLSGVPLARSEKRITARGCWLRVVSANVGSMVGKGEEIVNMTGRRNLELCSLQKTRWKGNAACGSVG